ncbi:MAG: Tryptophanase [Myxococcales bacterium]|nr:Tryptophanase [Myxococcales bacterium]
MSTAADAIARAGYNIFNLLAEQIEIDLVSDVPARSPLAEIRDAYRNETVDLDAAARRLYGDWRFVFTTKGRAAELALSRAVIRSGMTVLTNGLFRTTHRSLTTQGAKVESVPKQVQVHGSSNVSLAWLAERFAAGGVDALFLEPSNNGTFGWPLQLDNLRAVKQACAQHGAKLFLDATRLMSNCAALGDADLDVVREYLSLADAFVTSCAKECLVPMGAVIGMRDLEWQRQSFLNGFEEGSILEFQPMRAQLAAGFDTIRTRPSIITDRRRQLELLARLLRDAGIRTIEPIGAHAVFALLPAQEGDSPHRHHELQAHLFARSGIRFLFGHHPEHPGFVVRIPLALATYQDSDLERIVRTLKIAVDASGEGPSLVPISSDSIHTQYFGRFALRN